MCVCECACVGELGSGRGWGMGAGGRVLGRGARGGGGVCKLYRKKLSAGKLLNGSILLKTQMVDIGELVQY